MTKKGLTLFGIIFIGYLLKILVLFLLPNFIDVTDPSQYIKGLAPFKLLFGLIAPLIFITQFQHRSIFYPLGIFLIIIEGLSFIVAYTFGTSLYLYLGFTISIINILGLIIFATIAFVREEGKLIGGYLVLSTIYYVWVSQLVMTALSFSGMDVNMQNLIFGTIPMILQYSSLSLLLYLVLVESQKTISQKKE